MTRQPLQVLVFPFIKKDNELMYALFRREDDDKWQGIAGGGETGDTPIEAAKRETWEEARIDGSNNFIPLLSHAYVPVEAISGFRWGANVYLVIERAFGVEVDNKELSLSHEHTECGWFSFEDAMQLLAWDSNRTALWELNYRLSNHIDWEENKKVLLPYEVVNAPC